MKKSGKLIFIIILIFNTVTKAQIVNVPLDNEIYEFLARESVKENIIVEDEVRPWSRMYIANKIIELENTTNSLTPWEKEMLEFYKHEYVSEISKIKDESTIQKLIYFSFEYPDRFRVVKYSDSLFTFSAEPIINYVFGKNYKENQLERHNGINIYANISNNIGFYSNFIDNREEGTRLDITRLNSEKTGFVFQTLKNKAVEYDYVNAGLNYAWRWGNIGLNKDYLQWGSGERGQLIFSSKAPSFPFINFDISPCEWLDFKYIFGWLNSGVIDSSTIRNNINVNRQHYSEIEKYIASHFFMFKVLNNLSISLGESIVYSDKIEPIYFIPFISLRLADHYIMNRHNSEGGNAQIFADIRYINRNLKSVFYLSLFIDEMTVSNFFNTNPNIGPTEAAFTVGAKVIDPIMQNSEVVLEYTRLDPYIYVHSDDAQFYSNYNYQLGHWIGSNSDLIYFKYNQHFKRELELKIWGEYQRKGESELTSAAVKYSYPKFLYGKRRNMFRSGIEVNYEPYYSVRFQLKYTYIKITDEDPNRTLIYELGRNDLFGFSFSYGM